MFPQAGDGLAFYSAADTAYVWKTNPSPWHFRHASVVTRTVPLLGGRIRAGQSPLNPVIDWFSPRW